MAPLFGRLFSSEQTRGLSGDSAATVALDDANPYYNYRLRRHKAEGDLVADPSLLWYTSPYVKRRTGLGTHVAAEKGDGVATYTDVLLILSAEDHARALALGGEPWLTIAQRALSQEFDNFCRRENFSRAHAYRPIGFKLLCDGSPEMHGRSLGLANGEFVTGLLPNLYTGPARGSYPVIGVHINLPGVWDGYQEVGKLYNDQLLFTLGNHWLDNFQSPGLKEAALYRLQQAADGSFVHIINPDLQDRYQVTSTQQAGASVLTVGTRSGAPLAYLVLALLDPPAQKPEPAAERPGIAMPAQPAQAASDDRFPSVAPPMLLDDTLLVGRKVTRGAKKTIIPDAPADRIFTLQERGALLQKVHFGAFMDGYDVFLGANGELGTAVENRAVTFQVRKKATSLVVHAPGVSIDGAPMAAGHESLLTGNRVIEFGGQRCEYRDLRGVSVEGWPYVGEIRRPASSTYMAFGDDYTVGRSRESRVVLPDETRNDNIHWKASVGDGATIRARTGEIRKSQFYTDSIMVASEHARFELRSEPPKVVCIARHCYVFVRRADAFVPLYPASSEIGAKEVELRPGDEVMIGNCSFQVGFTPSAEADAARAASEVPGFAARNRSSAVPPNSEGTAPVRKALTPVSAALRTAPLDSLAGVPLGLAFDEAVNDEPTMPGMALSRELLGLDDPPPPPARPAVDPTSAPLPLAQGPRAELPEWDEDWDDPTAGAPLGLSADEAPPPPPQAVPPPFPDLPAADDHTWEEAVEPPPPPLRAEATIPPVSDESETPDAARPAPELAAAAFEGAVAAAISAAAETPVMGGTSDTTEASGPQPVPRRVLATDDADAQFELGRPMHLIQAGWAVNGEVVCGNHEAADLAIPENRVNKAQSFDPIDYFRLSVRGRRGTLEVLAPKELLIDEADPVAGTLDNLESRLIDVIRRDERGDEDFAVRLTVTEDKRLPDPRARFVAIDWKDPLAGALFTRGLPRGQPRTLTLGGVTLTLTYDAGKVRVSDYLATYRTGDTYAKFFVQMGEGRYKTAPEEGTAFELASGDRLVLGNCVYVLREE